MVLVVRPKLLGPDVAQMAAGGLQLGRDDVGGGRMTAVKEGGLAGVVVHDKLTGQGLVSF
jgi:hypothetical protein